MTGADVFVRPHNTQIANHPIRTANTMRSTRATAAVSRLNSRSEGRHYMMVLTNAGLFELHERIDGKDKPLSQALSQDEFVRLVDSLGPQKVRRVTKSDAAFAKQLGKKETP